MCFTLSPRRLALLVACLLGLASAPLRAAPYELGREIDYRLPPEDLSRRAAPLQVLPGPAFGGGEQVQYQAFDGTLHTLTRFRGKYVAVLLPDSWMGPGRLDVPLIEVLVDRSDLLYQTLWDLVGGEPASDGLLNIAFVPTCGFGCGYVGNKGIEIHDAEWAFDPVSQELAAGHTPDVISHEMAHNFDIYNPYLTYWGDFSHAWTTLLQPYTFVESREGLADRSPEDIAWQWTRRTFEKYMRDPSLTWEGCLRDGQCSIRNDAWAGTLWRLAGLHGPEAIRGYMSFLRAYTSGNLPSFSAEGRNDLHVEAMAAGASLNLGCYVDAWRWHASPALRARMASTYGSGNPFCEDLDADSFSQSSGDCDDGDSTVRPGAPEAINGRDDDCDGLLDEVTRNEPAGGDFPLFQPVAIPADVTGRITEADSDHFTFQIPSARRIGAELCPNPDFAGWLFFYNQNGSWLDFQHSGDCTVHTYDLDAAGQWRFSIDLNISSQPGGYRVALFEPDPRPAPPWATTASRLCGGSYVLTAAANGNGPAGATETRFWVSGIGPVGTVPFAPLSGLYWTPPPGFDPSMHKLRAQALSNGIPVSEFTALAPLVDHGTCLSHVTVDPTSGLRTGESGIQTSFTVVLEAPPASSVTIPLASNDPGEGIASPASLTFTTANWYVPQTVTVTGVDDSEDDGEAAYTIITAPTSSNDPAFQGIEPADVSVINADDEFQGDFFTVPPCRLLDTRLPAEGPVLGTGAERIFPTRGRCGIPASAMAVVANVTAINGTTAGHLRIYPGGTLRPNTSTINFGALQTRANNAILVLAPNGDGTLAVTPFLGTGGTVHLVVDVSGYFE